jgi:hypothetical protein
MNNREKRQIRSMASEFKTRDNGEGLFIEGYFSVFNSIYELWPGASETIAPGAFSNTLGEDIRALIDHETRLVLGRNAAGTLELKEDSHGLWGKVSINPNDTDAMNLYERVKRGDVNQCSFGFEIVSEETDFRDDGSIHWTVREVKLYEVSVVTFPAYEDTGISARKLQFEEIKKREAEAWKENMKNRLKGEQ